MDGLKYILVIKDDMSSFVWLCSTSAVNGDFGAELFFKLVSMFGTMNWLVTDQRSHFQNYVHEEMTRKFRSKKHFTTAYSAWSNGTVERVNRKILRSFKSLLSEWNLDPQDWPPIFDCVQSVLNQAPLRRLGKGDSGTFRSPLQFFTVIAPTRPLLFSLPIQMYTTAEFHEEIRASQVLKIEELQKTMGEMHKEVEVTVSSVSAKEILSHNAKTNVILANFQVGYYVLVLRTKRNESHKLKFLGMGPRRVSSVRTKCVSEVEGLLYGKK